MLRARPAGLPRSDASTLPAVLLLALWLGGCAGRTGATESGTTLDDPWRALAAERPTPLPGATRLSFERLELLGSSPWSLASPVPLELGLHELVVTNLLQRTDVHFVERRRFAAAEAAERAGRSRSPNAPALGISPGTELAVSVSVLPLGRGQTSLELRFVDPETSAILLARRGLVPSDADPVGLTRAVVSEIVEGLRELGRLPVQDNRRESGSDSGYTASGVPAEAVEQFLIGLGAEETWQWETARENYQAAVRSAPGFFEAEAALARTARLRLGGTLGES